jgi:hypothetical protein
MSKPMTAFASVRIEGVPRVISRCSRLLRSKQPGQRDFVILHRIALNLLKQERSVKVGLKSKNRVISRCLTAAEATRTMVAATTSRQADETQSLAAAPRGPSPAAGDDARCA